MISPTFTREENEPTKIVNISNDLKMQNLIQKSNKASR